jgi:hypothetical protein
VTLTQNRARLNLGRLNFGVGALHGAEKSSAICRNAFCCVRGPKHRAIWGIPLGVDLAFLSGSPLPRKDCAMLRKLTLSLMIVAISGLAACHDGRHPRHDGPGPYQHDHDRYYH